MTVIYLYAHDRVRLGFMGMYPQQGHPGSIMMPQQPSHTAHSTHCVTSNASAAVANAAITNAAMAVYTNLLQHGAAAGYPVSMAAQAAAMPMLLGGADAHHHNPSTTMHSLYQTGAHQLYDIHGIGGVTSN
jgi:hypothetical protein